ncbi:Processive diacylglycerol beta-glucosyltransferase [Bacillus sp. THAF10]|nr:Processive diacylglycerol beta-glucosyltransferase [Bacillus sp. THAF10]
MNQQTKILILTASYGNGHIQVARSLYDECIRRGFTCTKICNLYSESHPFITEITEKLYSKSFSYGKHFYKLFYYGTDKASRKKLLRWYYSYGYKRLSLLIEQEKPDIIINTFPINAVPEFRKKTGTFIPTFTILTDYCLHRLWLHEDIDKYFVATEELRQSLLTNGVCSSKIHVTGIPIRPIFYEEKNRDELFRKYRFSSTEKLILLSAGANGVMKNVKEVSKSILESTTYQMAVVCGTNQSLYEELSSLQKMYPDRFKAFCYVERMDELHAISSVLVSKPGGITLTEATAIGKPLILFRPVPGQEKENARYFENKGAALIVQNQEQLTETIHSLLENKAWQDSISLALTRLNKPHSQKSILDDILIESSKVSSFSPMRVKKEQLGN